MMAERISELDIELIDINMGCPAPKITKNGKDQPYERSCKGW